jgi:hypothetical protein
MEEDFDEPAVAPRAFLFLALAFPEFFLRLLYLTFNTDRDVFNHGEKVD